MSHGTRVGLHSTEYILDGLAGLAALPALSCLLASRIGETAMLAGWRATVVMVDSHFPMVKHGTAGAQTAGLSIP